jgi:hypothetical protein
MFSADLRHARPLRSLLCLAAIAGTMAGCQKPERAPGSPAPVAATPAGTDTAPLPASEYFEGLTEQAFTATPAQLDGLIAQARKAAARDGKTLAASPAETLTRRLTEIDAARASLNRANLAIASVEAFRLFVTSGPSSDGVPVEVSLLDYAGFRYGADLAAQPPRWEDAVVAADFAETQWRLIAPRVTDATLQQRVSAAITGLKTAARNQEPAAALRVDQTELDLVDELEAFFARPRG